MNEEEEDYAFTPVAHMEILSMIKESLNTTFVICNLEYEFFGKQEFITIFNHILPTSICLKTGYWPFYRLDINRSFRLCVCAQFGIPCVHEINASTKYQILLPPETSRRTFCHDRNLVRPYRYKIQMLKTVPTLPRGYSITMRITLRYQAECRRTQSIETEYFDINGRYTIVEEQYPNNLNLVFSPSKYLQNIFEKVFSYADWFKFDQRVNNGFTINCNETKRWTLCATDLLKERMRSDLCVHKTDQEPIEGRTVVLNGLDFNIYTENLDRFKDEALDSLQKLGGSLESLFLDIEQVIGDQDEAAGTSSELVDLKDLLGECGDLL